VAATRAGRAGEVGVEVDEDGPGYVAGGVVVARRAGTEPPPDVEDDGR
jgi:hypothetical protein